MPLPPSFAQSGFSSEPTRGRVRLRNGKFLKPIMIGVDGPSDSGKSEFAHSAPDPGLFIVLDRGISGMHDNPYPPEARRTNFGYKVVNIPLATTATQATFLEYWKSFYDDYKKALVNPDALTLVVDGDSDSWELQRLAEFGRLSQVPPHMYVNVNAARRAMYARAWDSGKVCIFTNKVKKEYKAVIGEDGNPVQKDGKEVREATGEMERQGFPDQDYLFDIQLRHFYVAESINSITKKSQPAQFGIRIMKCKPNKSLVGSELVGDDCNFPGLVQFVYPEVPLDAWGL